MRTIKVKLIFKKNNSASARLHFIMGIALIKIRRHSFSSPYLNIPHNKIINGTQMCITSSQLPTQNNSNWTYFTNYTL